MQRYMIILSYSKAFHLLLDGNLTENFHSLLRNDHPGSLLCELVANIALV